MSTVSAYYSGATGEAYASAYAASHDALVPFKAAKFTPYVSPADRVLDLGCGAGGVLKSLRCSARMGIEVNPQRANQARMAGIEVHDDLRRVPLEWATVAISHHCLEHVLQPYRELRELHRATREGGTLVLVTPIDDWRLWQVYDPAEVNRHLYTWTPTNLGHLLTETGWTVKSIQVSSWAVPLPSKPALWRACRGLLPRAAFDALCKLYGALLRRREVIAVAVKV